MEAVHKSWETTQIHSRLMLSTPKRLSPSWSAHHSSSTLVGKTPFPWATYVGTPLAGFEYQPFQRLHNPHPGCKLGKLCIGKSNLTRFTILTGVWAESGTGGIQRDCLLSPCLAVPCSPLHFFIESYFFGQHKRSKQWMCQPAC